MHVVRAWASRRHLSRLLSVVLVLLIGGLGLAATRSAGERAMEVHREDRLRIQQLLTSMTAQGSYAAYQGMKSLLEAQEASGAQPFSATAGGPRLAADVERLQLTLSKLIGYDAGAAVINMSGQVVAEWSPTGRMPDRNDPGLAPLVAAVTTELGTKLPMSGVLDAGGTPVAATGVPVVLADGSPGLFVGLWSLQANFLQQYNVSLSAKFGVEGWILDHRGLALAAPQDEQLGKPMVHGELLSRLPRTGEGLLDTEEAGTDYVSTFAQVEGTSWTGVAVEPRASFQGGLEAGSRRSQVAVLALLLLAGGGMANLHRRRETALQEVAHTDELTAVLNRRGWFEAAEQELQRSARACQPRALLFVDLDGLKQVNDVLGHREGDRAITDAAAVLQQAAGRGDLVGRLGGDEFVVLAAAGREAPAERIREALARHNASSDAAFELRFSLGLETWRPEDPCSLEELVRRADAVMYVDKTARPERRHGVLRLASPAAPSDVLVS